LWQKLTSIYKDLEKVLAVYFDKNFISEYKKSFQQKRNRGKSVSDEEKQQEQLTKVISFSGDYQTAIDLLITHGKACLDNIRFIEFLIHLGDFSVSQGEFNTAQLIYEKVLNESTGSNLEGFSAFAHMALGDLYSRQANWDKAVIYIRNASELYEKQKDYKGLSKCDNILGTIYGDKGDINQAQYHFEKSLSYLNPRRDDVLIGMLEINIGVLYNLRGHFDTALSYFHRAMIKFEKVQDLRRIAETNNDLGLLYTHKNEYDNALMVYDRSIAIALSINYLYALDVSYLSKAYIFAQTGDFKLADAFAAKAMEVAFKINDRLSIADIYKIKGIIDRNQKKFETAESYFRTSIRINQELENILNEAETYYEFSLMYVELNKSQEARELLNRALDNFRRINIPVMIDKVTKLLHTI
jgi:tetratricopeptide (TPR) repeat protein